MVIERSLDFTTGVTKHDLTRVCANKNLATLQPAMGRVVLRQMTVLLLVDRAHLAVQGIVFFEVVFVGLVSSDENYVLILAAE